MKKIFFLFGILVLVGCASLIPLKVGPPQDLTVESTPERIARGEYLGNNVVHCIYCHSKLDWIYYGGGKAEPGTEGAGGERFVENEGIIGSFDIYSRNITPAALGDWTDGELIQAITEGVNKKGEPLFPCMPYASLNRIDEEDLYSLVAYVRTLKPIPNTLPEKKIKRMFKYIERTFPKPYDPQPRPDSSDKVASGKYLATIGNCIFCHTTMTKLAKPLKGMDMAGGNSFTIPGGGVVFSANITPDMETGIGNRSKENFIGLFKSFVEPIKLPEDKKHVNTVMPWPAFAGMTEEDLGNIYEYLRTVKPVNNRVEKYPAETK